MENLTDYEYPGLYPDKVFKFKNYQRFFEFYILLWANTFASRVKGPISSIEENFVNNPTDDSNLPFIVSHARLAFTKADFDEFSTISTKFYEKNSAYLVEALLEDITAYSLALPSTFDLKFEDKELKGNVFDAAALNVIQSKAPNVPFSEVIKAHSSTVF